LSRIENQFLCLQHPNSNIDRQYRQVVRIQREIWRFVVSYGLSLRRKDERRDAVQAGAVPQPDGSPEKRNAGGESAGHGHRASNAFRQQRRLRRQPCCFNRRYKNRAPHVPRNRAAHGALDSIYALPIMPCPTPPISAEPTGSRCRRPG